MSLSSKRVFSCIFKIPDSGILSMISREAPQSCAQVEGLDVRSDINRIRSLPISVKRGAGVQLFSVRSSVIVYPQIA